MIGIVIAIAVPTLQSQTEKAKISAVAADLKTFETGFVSYQSDNSTFPPDHHLSGPYHLPAGVEAYIPTARWVETTPLGGNYNWEGPNNYPYAGVSVFQPTASASTFALLDAVLDDGNVGTGRFRIGTNGRYTYIIDE